MAYTRKFPSAQVRFKDGKTFLSKRMAVSIR
jgi:hypothetical protein